MSPCSEEDRQRQTAAATPREADLQFARQNAAWLPSFGELAVLAPVGIFCADAAGEYIFVNEKWQRTTGLNEAQAAGAGWLASIDAEDRERVTEEWRTAAAAGTEFRAEYRLHRVRGEETWVCSTAAVSRTPSGEVKRFLGILANINGRKRAEEALTASEERFRAFVDFNPAVAFIQDDAGNYLYLNHKGKEVLNAGRPDQAGIAEPLAGPHATSGLPACADDSATRSSCVTGDLHGGPPAEFGVEHREQDGTPRSYAVCKFPLPESEGRKYLGGIAVDITELERARRELSRSEARFRRLVESNLIGIAFLESGSRFTYANDRFLQLNRYSSDELRELDQAQLIAAEDLEAWRRSMEEASRTAGSEPLLVRMIRKDGTRTPVLTGFAALEPDTRGMACFAVDMSGPQRAETALRRSEERFRRLVGSNIIGIVTADRERILDANDAYLQIVGYTREELRAGKIRWRDMTPARYMRASEKCLEQMLATGMCPAFEKEHRHKDGHYVPILIGAALLERDPLEWVCFILDLTERKNMEERLREAQKFESIGMLAAGIAHDFNNLMAVVLGWTSFARDGLAKDGLVRGGEIDRALEFVSGAADRAANLTRQLLAYAGKGSVLVESLDFSAAVRQAVAQTRGLLSPDVELRMELPDELPPIQADPTAVSLLVTNLLMNAIEAIGEGSGTICIEAGVRSSAADAGTPNGHGPIHGTRWIGLTVQDTGCGMDPAIQTRIFDPFFTTKFMGRGLGLAAVHGIVRSMQGFIRIDSAPGRGSTFEIYLPLP